MSRRELVDVAMGRSPAQVVVRGGRLVNVSTAEIYAADVAVHGGRIAAVGDVGYAVGPDTRVIDAEGRYVTPGLVDAHVHSYHSYLGVEAFVEALVSRGVTAFADGFYGQGVVGGPQAVRFLVGAFGRMPIRLLFVVPTLAYLQNRELGLTPAPGIGVEDMQEMLDWPCCYGLEEPPFVPIVDGYPEFLDLFEATLARRKVITGHLAGAGEREIQALAAMGCATDHEAVELEDALRKARAGVRVLMRQGSGAPNVRELVRAYTERGIDPRALAFATDLATPEKLAAEGTIDESVRIAVAAGVPPVTALQLATINPAETFFAQQDLGMVAPGRFADMLLVDDLERFAPSTVLVGGEVVARDGELVVRLPRVEYPRAFYGTVTPERPVAAADLAVRAPGRSVEARVIGVLEGSLATEERRATLAVSDGTVLADLEADVLHLAMVDRLGKGTGTGLGFVQGFGLRRGAIGSTVNAVCENLVLVGSDLDDMAVAAAALVEAGGGKVVVAGGRVLALVELPLLGLLSDEPGRVVMEKFERAFVAIAELGCRLRSPFAQLEFCFACGEIGDLKLSEEGLVRTSPPGIVPLLL